MWPVFLFLSILTPPIWADFEDTPSTDGQFNLEVEHSLDAGQSFQDRGLLTVHSIRSKSFSSDPTDLTSEQKAQLKTLCDQGDLYLLRIKATNPATSQSSLHRSVADPCLMIANAFQDTFTLHLDWKSQLVSLSVMPTPTPGQASLGSLRDHFQTKVAVQLMEAGPQPDTSAFIQKVEQEKLAQQRGETKDNRSFLAKYWMYIVPVVLMLAMSSANPEGQGGGR
ncbi:hypothetical protein TCAL_02103 [Tigriopus californicus]|uniref:ER membrane protein complex subunit 10 n=2 Tax=Tigriopus californicus TaxID=6832 RepID=A0A553ND31_TIGCA|nr:hypothetical protein TCAL_02103 [Tigriopus californicus]|eukprot:TCALIF_02103-PA protein Name:"Similar to Emc10 ER membrane protein complex subunit 10 (Mus musculus)" AED:0.02 eAED:0.02 QI:0/-1/0/1/-1/1/1/0/223